MYHLLKGPILRLSVSFDDHSHLIGKKGISHKNLQILSKTLIHFPEKSARLSSAEANFPLSFQGEDEVLITPTELELKKEPCAEEIEDRLLEVFSSSIEHIRLNQLVIFTVPFKCPPSLHPAVQQEISRLNDLAKKKAIGIHLSYPGLTNDHWEVFIRGTVRNSASVVSFANQLKERLSTHFNLPVFKLSSTTRIPSAKWASVVAKFSNVISKKFGMISKGQIPVDCILNMYLKTIGVDVDFDGKSLVVISSHDPSQILEVKSMLVKALPMNLLIASNTVDSSLDSETVKILEGFYSVKIGTNLYGCASGESNTMFSGTAARRFFIGQKTALEGNNGNVASLLEVKWIISHPLVSFYLNMWCTMRNLWDKSYPGMPYPACLQTPKNFIEMETRTNMVQEAISTLALFGNLPSQAVQPPMADGVVLAAQGVPVGPPPISMPAAQRQPLAAVAQIHGPVRELRPRPAGIANIEPMLQQQPQAASTPMRPGSRAIAAPMLEPRVAALNLMLEATSAPTASEPATSAASMLGWSAAPAPLLESMAEQAATSGLEPTPRPPASPMPRVAVGEDEPTREPGPIAAGQSTWPWGSSGEDDHQHAGWQWRGSPPNSARSRGASSSDIFGSSPEFGAVGQQRRWHSAAPAFTSLQQ